MRAIFRIALLCGCWLVAACGDDDGTGPPPATLVGSWQATKIELVNASDSGMRVDFVAMGGSGTLILEEGSDFTLTITVPGDEGMQAAGTWSSSDVLTLDFQTGMLGQMQFDIDLTGSVLKLTGASAEYDFDDDGTEDPAVLNLSLVRS